jgi:methylated-DNA-[protein]-cysteine S-methyltransferase
VKRTEQKQAKPNEKLLVETPIGMLIVSAKDGAVCAIDLAGVDGKFDTNVAPCPVLQKAALELKEYFEGKRTGFTFPMRAEGTPFQMSVWDALLTIPFGETRTYGEIARQVQNEKGSRAVGMACNKNPIMIAVPCHRVVGANGSLTGYAGGLPIKQSLLLLEQKNK